MVLSVRLGKSVFGSNRYVFGVALHAVEARKLEYNCPYSNLLESTVEFSTASFWLVVKEAACFVDQDTVLRMRSGSGGSGV